MAINVKVRALEGKYSDIVLGVVDSSDRGFNFRELQVTFAKSLRAGMLVDKTGVPVAPGDAAKAYGVLVDRDLLPGVDLDRVELIEGEKYAFNTAIKGVTFNFYALCFADGTAITDAAAEALEDAGNNHVTKHYFGTYGYAKP
ncbi:hypothetical protein KASHIRA_00700 [Serratia phage vB_SmaM-Kashira]|nr:hypothetical protein KASHIRA_00700 [Serratia phage vB_SmaM-Kashira]